MKIKPGNYKYGGSLPYEDYIFILDRFPVFCVDLMLVRNNNISGIEVLLFKRRNDSHIGRWCMIGGRLWKGETIKKALKRQGEDIGVKFQFVPPFSSNLPIWINDKVKQVPSKLAVTAVYPAKITSEKIKKVGNEYTAYRWFNKEEILNKNKYQFAYDHKNKVVQSLKILEDIIRFKF